MAVTRYTVPVNMATASGTTARTTGVHGGGFLEAVRFVKTAFATVANLSLTGEISGIRLFGATCTASGSQTWFPRDRITDTSGTPQGLSSDLTPTNQFARIPVGQERINVVVASGGAAASGTVHVYISGA